MNNKIKILFVLAALMTPGMLKAQTASAVFDPKATLTWLGLDFSQAKFIGDQVRFGQGDKLKTLLGSWNELMLKESDKYNVGTAFGKKFVVPNFTAVIKHNEELDFSMLLTENPGEHLHLDKAGIQAIVASYDLGGLSGLGVMINIESFNKAADQGVGWITFIDLSSQQVIFTERETGPPGGFGIRNYWAGSIVGMLKGAKKDFTTWRKKYPDNYAEAPYDGPAPENVAKREVVKKTEPVVAKKKADASGGGSEVIKPGGKYYALLIGISKYADPRMNLEHPVLDARKMKETLTQGYDFNAENTILLENPSRSEIFAALYKLRNKVTSNDNLLIFYAGHGYWDEKIKQGYWWPRDATSSDPSNWLSNSDLREQLRGISSAHTLLVSDACFSGGIFRTRDASSIKSASIDYQMLYKLPSRRAITSGTLTAVPDRSVFVEYLIKRLSQNQEKFLSSQTLFSNIRLAVINNSATVPQEGVIAETGDEGGDFIFMKK